MPTAYDKELGVALEAAKRGAEAVMAVYSTDFAVEYKDAREPVTAADQRSNALICAELAEAFPEDAVVAEETAPRDPAQVLTLTSQPRVWFVDPLDGTKEFIAHNGEFAVMIGLAVRGRPVVGVVAVPARGEVFLGAEGAGAWRITETAREEMRVSEVADLGKSTLIVSRSHRSDGLNRLIERLGVAQKLPCGSVGLKASRIAAGEVELYLYLHNPHGAKLWDSCAPEAIVHAAGGMVSKLDGSERDYRSGLGLEGGLLATNGKVHEAALRAIALDSRG